MKIVSTIFFLIIYFLSSVWCTAQKTTVSDFTSLSTDHYTYANLSTYKFFLDSITSENSKSVDKKLRPDYSAIIKEKNDALVKEITEHKFLYNTAINEYLENIFYLVLKANNLVKGQFHFFVSRSTEANACSLEDGTIIFNIGLFQIVENESQLAMVLCHEIAHYLFGHSTKSVIGYLEKYNSPEFLSQVKSIKKQKFNRKRQLQDLLSDDIFNRRKHNRLQEFAADSLGMELFNHTRFNNITLPYLFDLLDDNEHQQAAISIQAFFLNQGIILNDDLFKENKKITFGVAAKQKVIDSLQTHPDCAKRKLYAQSFFAKQNTTGSDFLVGDPEKLAGLKKEAILIQCGLAKEENNLSNYFYQLIELSPQFKNNSYLATEIFNTLVALCASQKAHQLHTVIKKNYVAYNTEDEYAKLLLLLDRIDLPQFIDIAEVYYKKNILLIKSTPEIIINFNTLKQK